MPAGRLALEETHALIGRRIGFRRFSFQMQPCREANEYCAEPEIVPPRTESLRLLPQDRDRGTCTLCLAQREGNLLHELQTLRIVLARELKGARVIARRARHVQDTSAVSRKLEEISCSLLEVINIAGLAGRAR